MPLYFYGGENCMPKPEHETHPLMEDWPSIRKKLKTGDKNAIHAFRVWVKKFTTFYALVKSVHPATDAEEMLSHLEDLFAFTGDIRKRSIRLALCKKYDFPLEWKLKKSFKKKRSGLLKLASKIRKTPKKTSAFGLPELDDPVKISDAVLFFTDNHLQEIRKLLTETGTEKWHAIRKILKQIYYANSLFPGVCHVPVFDLFLIKKTEALIGEWHDLEDFMAWMISEKNRAEIPQEIHLQIAKMEMQLQSLLAEIAESESRV